MDKITLNGSVRAVCTGGATGRGESLGDGRGGGLGHSRPFRSTSNGECQRIEVLRWQLGLTEGSVFAEKVPGDRAIVRTLAAFFSNMQGGMWWGLAWYCIQLQEEAFGFGGMARGGRVWPENGSKICKARDKVGYLLDVSKFGRGFGRRWGFKGPPGMKSGLLPFAPPD